MKKLIKKTFIIFAIITIIATFTAGITAFAASSATSASGTVVNRPDNFDTSKFGDVNNDGKVNAADARLLLRVSARLESSSSHIKTYGDYNSDGKITAADARTALRISAALETKDCYLFGHDMIKTTKKPTCTEKGYKTSTCKRCDFTNGKKENITNPTSHSYKASSTVKATCKSEGYDLLKCSTCNTTKKSNIQPKTTHTMKKGSVIKGTCASDGYTEYKCSVCGYLEKKNITKAGGHKYEYVSKEQVYKEGMGYFVKATKKCIYCKDTIETYDEGTGNTQVPATLIHSKEAYAIKEKFDVPYYIEGHDISGKKIVIYSNLDGIDIEGYYYKLDGTLIGNCPYCNKILGEGNNMCNGRCRLSWG